ncbi:hypothetical protein EW146_g4472 [Bondarzewia mesenterica]|uniref:Ubiquitin 3 binding protein But2 C-terminal domain-containing protein n=1 Tax=Bondarzewia mesenterica TaxID=1095465 RepID=A0A4S4LUE5_9AGAM|nr:hypothetical protein EW146_g4472 [Bondarzewia mesenterica]
MAPNIEYVPLRRQSSADDQEYGGLLDDEDTESPIKRSGRTGAAQTSSIFDLPFLLSCFAFFVSLLSLSLTAYQFLAPSSLLRTPSVQRVYDINVDTLRRPSLYMGLERVPLIRLPPDPSQGGNAGHGSGTHNISKPQEPEILPVGLGRATAMAHTNSLNPSTSYPNDGWILITEHDTTFLQFVMPSPAASSCTFHISLPTRAALIQSAKLLTLENTNTPAGVPALEIYAVDAADVDFARLTWTTRPPRRGLIGRVDAAFGTNTTVPNFNCGGEQLTIELTCVGEGCRVEYREEGGEPVIVVFHDDAGLVLATA